MPFGDRRRRLLLIGTDMYFTDRGIEELQARRGEDEVSLAWLADQLRTFVDLYPEFETPVERLATWLARLDEEDEEKRSLSYESGQIQHQNRRNPCCV